MVPFSVLDLPPIPQGATASDALRNTLDLARHVAGRLRAHAGKEKTAAKTKGEGGCFAAGPLRAGGHIRQYNPRLIDWFRRTREYFFRTPFFPDARANAVPWSVTEPSRRRPVRRSVLVLG